MKMQALTINKIFFSLKALLWIRVIITTSHCCSQNIHDNNWLIGEGNSYPEIFFSGSLIEFNGAESPTISLFDVPSNYSAKISLTMSDPAGNLIFYTNGCNIFNKNNDIMENGSGLNPGPWANEWCGNNIWYYNDFQALLAIPWPGKPNEYLLFHSAWTENQGGLSPIIYFYTHIDMNANNGEGRVVSKNNFITGPHSLVPSTSAVRHANGRDWWVIFGDLYDNIFYSILVSPQGLGTITTQNWHEQTWQPGHLNGRASAFSPDGSKFVRTVESTPALFHVFDFDRCSGLLSNPLELSLPDSVMAWAWPSFSPNSRYLYLTNRLVRLYQYDLQSTDVNASSLQVGEWDGYRDTAAFSVPVATSFNRMTHGIDGKIYLSSFEHTRYLHVINEPDSPGLSCHFQQRKFLLPTVNSLVPNYPNYRLGPLDGSLCDTLGLNSIIETGPNSLLVSVTPNPSSEKTTLSFNHPLPEGSYLVIYSVTGQVFVEKIIEKYTSDETINTSTIPSGIYLIKIFTPKGHTIPAARLVVVH